jgi:hypothetical protein
LSVVFEFSSDVLVDSKKDISKSKILVKANSRFEIEYHLHAFEVCEVLFDQIVVQTFLSDMVFGIAYQRVQGQKLWV